MKAHQVEAIYTYIISTTNEQEVLNRLAGFISPWGNAENSVLFLPMFSMGMGPGTIMPRIEWLRNNGWDRKKLAEANEKCRVDISNEVLSSGKSFGMKHRVNELVKRACQIEQFGTVKLNDVLTPSPDWQEKDLLEPLKILQTFDGISLTAALHILMELHWGVVKPDRHICRFLSRLGGDWLDYFLASNSEAVNPEALIFFLEAWRNACSEFDSYQSDSSPSQTIISKLSPRQIDILIMWYTQDILRWSWKIGQGDKVYSAG